MRRKPRQRQVAAQRHRARSANCREATKAAKRPWERGQGAEGDVARAICEEDGEVRRVKTPRITINAGRGLAAAAVSRRQPLSRARKCGGGLGAAKPPCRAGQAHPRALPAAPEAPDGATRGWCIHQHGA